MTDVAHIVLFDSERYPWLVEGMTSEDIAKYTVKHKIAVEALCAEIYIPPAGNPDDRPLCEACLARSNDLFDGPRDDA